MAQIVKPHVIELGSLADATPRLLKIDKMLPGLL